MPRTDEQKSRRRELARQRRKDIAEHKWGAARHAEEVAGALKSASRYLPPAALVGLLANQIDAAAQWHNTPIGGLPLAETAARRRLAAYERELVAALRELAERPRLQQGNSKS